MAKRIPEFQAVRVDDRKTVEDENLTLLWKEKNCLRILFRMRSELRGSTSISMQQPSARMNERSFLA